MSMFRTVSTKYQQSRLYSSDRSLINLGHREYIIHCTNYAEVELPATYKQASMELVIV